MSVKLQIAVSRTSLIFQKRFPDAGSTEGRWNKVSTSCTRTHVATSKQRHLIPKNRKKCPLKPSYVAPRAFRDSNGCRRTSYEVKIARLCSHMNALKFAKINVYLPNFYKRITGIIYKFRKYFSPYFG